MQNLLRNHDLCQYYLDHLEHLLDTTFTEPAILGLIGEEGGSGLWERVRHAAYLEADTPNAPPFTGRQFTNDEVYLTAYKENEISRGGAKIEGITHYIQMRSDSARQQLASLRKEYPSGASGATFSGMMDPLPNHG